jgi:hypothetical protein
LARILLLYKMKGDSMRKQMMILSFLMVCFPLVVAHAGSNYHDYSYARMSYVQGDVFIQRTGDLGYEQGVVNLGLIQGDKLGTREGRTEIHLGRKNFLRVNSYTQLDIAGLPDEYEYRVQLHLLSGEVFLRVNNLEREKDIEIHTPDASYYILENGLYRFLVRNNLETELQVLSGAVEAAAEEGSLLIYAEESLRAADGRFTNDPVLVQAGWNDSFYEWNQSRDALHSRRVERHYLPNDLYDYEAELAYYGDWVNESSHGYVWIPRTTVRDWRPYWNGRWVWYPVIGWTWVSYEPWGWCVSHYGRWHWSGRLGWYWIPTRTWGPAWVHWYHGSHYVGWSPLSYWGYPGVVINNHYYGRYYRDSYPIHSRALTMVRKDQLQDRHISRISLNHNEIRNVHKISLSAIQPDIRPAVNRDAAKTRVAAQALERSKTRTVKSMFSSSRTGAVRSRADAGRIRNSEAGVSRDSSQVSRGSISRGESVRRTPTGSQSSLSRTGTAERGEMERGRVTSGTSTRIKTYPSSRENAARTVRNDTRRRVETRQPVSRERVIPRVSTTSSRNKASGNAAAERIKRYPSSNPAARNRNIESNDRSSLSRNSAVSSRERRNSGASSRNAQAYSSSRTILNQRRSSRYISGSSSSATLRNPASSSRRGIASRSSGYIRNPSASSSSLFRSSSSRSSTPHIASPRSSSLSRSRIQSTRTSSRSISRPTSSRSSSTVRRSSSRSSATKKRKK